jgi:hypothetical protein
MPQPQAFMSYAHIDDRHRRLTQFRKELSDEVQVHLGREFPIFQDWNDLGWVRTGRPASNSHWSKRPSF